MTTKWNFKLIKNEIIISYMFGALLYSCSPNSKTQYEDGISLLTKQSEEINEKAITFFILSDTHYGKEENTEFINSEIINAMNKVSGTNYPIPLSGTVAIPKGVIVTGDLTEGEEVTLGAICKRFWTQWRG
jgi:hypothetical protein